MRRYEHHWRSIHRGIYSSYFSPENFLRLGTVITTMNVSLAKTPLHPSMNAIDGYLLVLCDLFEKIDTYRQHTLTTSEPEALHRLRIAIRQARSVLREGRKVLPSTLAEAMSDDLAWLSSITGEARDLDMLVEHWPTYERMVEAKEVNRLQVIIREIHFRQKDVYREMRALLNGQRAITLINEWQVLMIDGTDFGDEAANAHDELQDVVTRRLAKAHRQLQQDCRRIDAKSSDHDIHALRKDAKRIRYLVESFSEIFPSKNSDSILPQLLNLQDTLGEFQDLRIHEAVITDALAYLRPIYTPSTIDASEELLSQMRRRRQKLRKKVISGLLKY